MVFWGPEWHKNCQPNAFLVNLFMITPFLFHEVPTLLGVNTKGAMRWPVDFYARGHPPGFPSPVLHCIFAI